MNVLSLFDGISCGMVALERAGIKVDNYYAYEIEPNAIKISKKNYPWIEQRGDVTTEDFRKYRGKIDLLIGGSPCQGFSRMGVGLNFDDVRSKLFFEYVRALRECQPRYFLLENVKMKKEWQDVISEIMGVEPILINSSLVSAQNRERLYWTNIPNVTTPKDKNIKLYNVIDITNRRWRPIETQKWCLAFWGNVRKIDKMRHINIEKAGALTTSSTHTNGYYCNADKTALTTFTADEAEILQTLPKGYTQNAGVAEINRFKCIGNGWTVDVIAHILRDLKNV